MSDHPLRRLLLLDPILGRHLSQGRRRSGGDPAIVLNDIDEKPRPAETVECFSCGEQMQGSHRHASTVDDRRQFVHLLSTYDFSPHMEKKQENGLVRTALLQLADNDGGDSAWCACDACARRSFRRDPLPIPLACTTCDRIAVIPVATKHGAKRSRGSVSGSGQIVDSDCDGDIDIGYDQYDDCGALPSSEILEENWEHRGLGKKVADSCGSVWRRCKTTIELAFCHGPRLALWVGREVTDEDW